MPTDTTARDARPARSVRPCCTRRALPLAVAGWLLAAGCGPLPGRVLTLAEPATPEPAVVAPPGPGPVDIGPEAIERKQAQAIDQLRRLQRPDGLWQGHGYEGQYDAAPGSLAVYAMRVAGVPENDPALQRGLEAIHQAEARSHMNSYRRAARLMALSRFTGDRHALLARQDIAALARSQLPSGGWSYGNEGEDRERAVADNANTQFAILALAEAAQAGYAVPQTVWNRARTYWLRNQNADGGFGYAPHLRPESYPSMTAGGLASLALIADRAPLSGPADAQRTQQLAIVRARQWLDRYFAARSPDMNLCQGAWTEVYGWWSIERAGYATGLRRFGRTHWLTVGSRRLLSADADGLWGKRFDETIDTSLALLFLKAGHRPRSFGKLLLADQQDQTPGDLRQLARQLSRMREELLGWEAIRLSENELADGLLEVPILLVSIDAPVRLSPRTRAALAEYVRRGGFLLVVTDPGDAAGPAAAPTPAPRRPPPGTMVLGDSPETADGPSDAAGFRWPADQTAPPETPAARAIARELDRALGPAGFMQAPLPVQHPLWRTHYNLQPLPATRQWSDGVTTRALLVYARLDRAWERGDPAATPQAFQLAANLLVYVADGRPLAQLNLARLQATLPAPLPRQRISLGRTDLFTIASLRHRGRWQAADLAPAGLARLAAQTLNAPAGWYPPVRANRAQLAGVDMLWLGGVDEPALSTVELAALEAYARAGGLIVASNPGGAGRFTTALEAQLATRPGWRIEPLAAGHPLLTGQLPGDVPSHDLRKMRLALLPRAVAPASPRAETPPGPPDLRALRYQGALVGILCPADLSYAAADLPCFGRVGYAREDTLKLVQNLIALARLPAGQRDGPPAPPG